MERIVIMDAFLELYGQYKIYTLVLVVLATRFVYVLYTKTKEYFRQQYIEEKRKDDMLEMTFNKVNEFSKLIEEIKEQQENHARMLEKMDRESRQRELNVTRDRLLQLYRYYTSKDKNPLQAWTEMEAQAFWDIFTDYESLGGDGLLHTEVQPAMTRLAVISMGDSEGIQELFRSRK